jgi:hypothetical protein
MTPSSMPLANVIHTRLGRTVLPSPDLLDIALTVGSFGLFTLPLLLRGSGHGPTAAILVLGAAAACRWRRADPGSGRQVAVRVE